MPKSLRYLRITWTVFCGITCVLLCVLWVRSYWWHDTVNFQEPPSRVWAAGWNKGELFFVKHVLPDILHITLRRELSFQHEEPDYEHNFEDAHLGFQLTPMPGGFFLLVPFWFTTVGSIVCGALPWLRWRFTTRTLLLAVTAVAVVLGMIVWATR